MGRWTSERGIRALTPVAENGPLPEFIEPSLAVLAAEPPTSGEWGYEIKFDGYPMRARIDAGDVRIFTREQPRLGYRT